MTPEPVTYFVNEAGMRVKKSDLHKAKTEMGQRQHMKMSSYYTSLCFDFLNDLFT